ncbi:PIH1 domain-containing protein 2 [Durusdinium trenchii]|uniref:PIH1 domain-containing protein 1 n=1 Tax=Durusdinium trenchii TaxID=1381693 RepID=A0ABP0KHU8_9DINO
MSLAAAARQLGLDKGELGPEASGFWDKLNEMAEKDPQEYARFIEEQMKQAKEAENTARRGFRPQPGFLVETSFLNAVEGARARTCFVNLCSFEGVEPPQDASGKSVSGTAQVNLSGLSIPLVVGPIRDTVDDHGELAIALDAIFNPWVIQQAQEFSAFQTQVVELALQWCEPEARGKLSRKYKTAALQYKGFEQAVDGSPVAVFFEVKETEEEKAHTAKARAQAEAHAAQREKENHISQPQDLLGALRRKQAEEEAAAARTAKEAKEAILSGSKSTSCTGAGKVGMRESRGSRSSSSTNDKKVLVQEVGETSSSTTSTKPSKAATKRKEGRHSATNTKKSDGNSAVKKGFLNNTKATLYDEKGSGEAKPTSIYQRAQIVDLNKMSEDEARAVMEQHARGGNPCSQKQQQQQQQQHSKPDLSDPINTLLRETMESMDSMSTAEKDAFARLAEAADEELSKSSIAAAGPETQNQLSGLFGDLAKAMQAAGEHGGVSVQPLKAETSPCTSQATSNASSKAQPNNPSEEQPTVANPAPPLGPAAFTVEHCTDKAEVVVRVSLPGVKSLANVEVEVSERKVRVFARGYFVDTPIKLPVRIDRDSARAKLSKKSSKLTIRANELT